MIAKNSAWIPLVRVKSMFHSMWCILCRYQTSTAIAFIISLIIFRMLILKCGVCRRDSLYIRGDSRPHLPGEYLVCGNWYLFQRRLHINVFQIMEKELAWVLGYLPVTGGTFWLYFTVFHAFYCDIRLVILSTMDPKTSYTSHCFMAWTLQFVIFSTLNFSWS